MCFYNFCLALLGYAFVGNSAQVDQILESSTLDPNKVIDNMPEIALHLAVQNNNTIFVQTLLKFPGIDTNVKNNDGETP